MFCQVFVTMTTAYAKQAIKKRGVADYRLVVVAAGQWDDPV